MSNVPDAPGRSWRTSALTVLGYAAVVVTALALVGPFVAETIAKIAFLLLGAASWLRGHSDPQSDAGENEDAPDTSPDSTPIQA